MIESIEFSNYKALRDTTLPLAPFTLLLGPNGSGKTSVMQALSALAVISSQHRELLKQQKITIINGPAWRPARSAATGDTEDSVEIKLRISDQNLLANFTFQWPGKTDQLRVTPQIQTENGPAFRPAQTDSLFQWIIRTQCYALDPGAIAEPFPVNSGPLQSNGRGLAAVLDEIKDNHPERWELLLGEMREWLPEYDHIQFVKPSPGQKSIALRTKKGGHQIPATELSQGTLVALALLTLAYLPNPPSLIGLEEIDRGLHPRLLRHLQDALYRLSYPESCGEKRPAIQVIATTHSPYLLDLYREHPEEVVLAQKEGLEVKFQRLSDIEHFSEILGDAPLSDVWYSGVLGGVTVKP